jgi:hypothetical protein
MMDIGGNEKILIAIVAIVDLMLFSQMEPSTLIGVLLAAVLVLVGLASLSRSTSVIGMMLASGSAAASLGHQSLTIVGNLLNSAIGLFLPVYLLAWIALSAEVEPRPLGIRRGPAVLTAIFAIVCLMSVGMVAFALGVAAPAISIGMSALMEIAIVLLTATTGIAILALRKPQLPVAGVPGEETAPAEGDAAHQKG